MRRFLGWCIYTVGRRHRNVQGAMDNVQIREYGGGVAGIGADGAANGNVQISELGACGAALFLFSPPPPVSA